VGSRSLLSITGHRTSKDKWIIHDPLLKHFVYGHNTIRLICTEIRGTFIVLLQWRTQVDWNKLYLGEKWGGKEAETIDQSCDTKSRVGRLETFGCCCQSRSKKYEKYKERRQQNITELEYVDCVTSCFVHTYIHTLLICTNIICAYIHTYPTSMHIHTHTQTIHKHIHIYVT